MQMMANIVCQKLILKCEFAWKWAFDVTQSVFVLVARSAFSLSIRMKEWVRDEKHLLGEIHFTTDTTTEHAFI